MSKILAISSSLRSGSNSDILLNSFIKGAQDSGNEVIKVSLKNKNIHYCLGCLKCQQNNQCVIKDDVNDILEIMKEVDIICFASPVYFYGISGLLKTFLDRTNPLYSSDYKFTSIYLLATCADTDCNAIDPVITNLNGWICCFDNVHLKGVIKGLGVNSCYEIEQNTTLIKKSYDMGLKIK